MILREVPPAHLISWGGWWMPYAARVAKREGCELSCLVGEALTGEARIFVIWDNDGKPTGAAATRLLLRNDTKPIGELHWLAGDGMTAWFDICLPQLHEILIRDHGVADFKTTVRKGLAAHFKRHGYREIKRILEKGAGV